MTANTDATLIQTPSGFDSTTAEVIDGIDLSGKRAIVTDGSSGIGTETARALARAGTVVRHSRCANADAGDRTAAGVTASNGNPVRAVRLTFADSDTPNNTIFGAPAYALDPANANRLWELSLLLLGSGHRARIR
jgi:hypothetical protein